MSKHLISEHEKALRLRKILDVSADIFASILVVMIGLALILTATIVVNVFWVTGVGYVPIVLAVVGTLVGVWLYLNKVVDKKLDKHRK